MFLCQNGLKIVTCHRIILQPSKLKPETSVDARITIWKYYRQVNDQVALGKMNHFHFIQVPEFKLSGLRGQILMVTSETSFMRCTGR